MAEAQTTGAIHFIFSYDDGGMVIEDLGYFTSEEAANTGLNEYVEAKVEEYREADRATYAARLAEHGQDRSVHMLAMALGREEGPFLTPAPKDPEDPSQYDRVRRLMRSGLTIITLNPNKATR